MQTTHIPIMQFERDAASVVVTTELLDEPVIIRLKIEEARRIAAGEALLRSGVIIRRAGDLIELRNPRPGVATHRRVLATAPLEKLINAC